MRSTLLALLAGSTLSGADWPQYTGPSGNFAIPADAALGLDAAAMRQVWESEVRLGPGKVRYSGNNAPLPSVGLASPIIVGDLVLQAYLWPSGREPAKGRPADKNGKPPNNLLDHLVRADDCLVAVDRATGATRWTFIAKEQGVNNVPDKRGGWGVTPAAADGRVFMLGSGGMLYGVTVADGSELWRTPIQPLHDELAKMATAMLADTGAGRRPFNSMLGNLVVVDGTLVVPDVSSRPECGLIGIDPANGAIRWQLSKVISHTSTPTVWRDGDGKPLLLCGTQAGTVNLIDPLAGKLLWSRSGYGRLTAPLIANRAGLVLLDGNPADREDGARFACFAIGRAGAEARWKLPDEERYHGGRGGGDGAGYLRAIPWGDDRFLHYNPLGKDKPTYLDVHAASDGRLIASTSDIPSNWDCNYLPIGDRILGEYQLGHWGCELAWFRVEGDRVVPSGSVMKPKDGASAYEVPFMQVPVDGRLVLRYHLGTYTKPGAHGGLRCFDLRTQVDGKPAR